MVSKICGMFLLFVMVSLATVGYAQSPAEDPQGRLETALKRFEEIATLKAERDTAERAEQKVRDQLKANPKEEATQQALVTAQAQTQAKAAALTKAVRESGLRGSTAPLVHRLVSVSPKDGTLAVLRAIDQPFVQQLTGGLTAPAVAGLQSGLLAATTQENAAAVRAAIEQHCAEAGDSPAAGWAARFLYWKTGADPQRTLEAVALPKALRDQAAARWVDGLLAQAAVAPVVSRLEAAVTAAPSDYQSQVKSTILSDPRSVPTADQKDAYLAFIADQPNQAELKVRYFLKTRSAPELKALILERVKSGNANYGQDLGPGVLRVLSADDVAELDATAQGQSVNLLSAVVLRRTAYGDPLRMTVLSAQAYAEECKFAFRAADGRITRDSVRAVLEHLVDGKGELAVPVSDTPKAFGARLPEGTYPSLMFRGEFLSAAQLAYGQLKAAKSDSEYVQAAARLRQAIQCLDRCYNGRSLETLKWLNGQTDACPVPELGK